MEKLHNSIFEKLKQAAKAAMESPTKEEGMRHLAQAFTLFSQETQRLKERYAQLESRFQEVNTELDTTNMQLRAKLIELQTLSSYLTNILKNISQGIMFIDKEGIITTCNEACADLLHMPKEKLLWRNFWSLFSDDFFGFSMRRSLDLGICHKTCYMTLSIPGKENKEIEVSTSYVTDSPKDYQGVILLLRDITQIQKLQMTASLNDRMKELGQIAATVAHEIRNPLGGIRGYSSLLYRDLEKMPHLQEMAYQIIEGTKALERLVSNVLHFARPIEIHREPVDIKEMIQELIKFVKVDPACPSHVRIDLHLPQEKFIVSLDKQLFHSALLNLLSNAFQAIETEEGIITISLVQNNDNLVLNISDTGKGIDPTDQEKIFTPFFTTKATGTGLGLAETYKILQAHFSHIEVRSQPKVGTTFTITIPLKK